MTPTLILRRQLPVLSRSKPVSLHRPRRFIVCDFSLLMTGQVGQLLKRGVEVGGIQLPVCVCVCVCVSITQRREEHRQERKNRRMFPDLPRCFSTRCGEDGFEPYQSSFGHDSGMYVIRPVSISRNSIYESTGGYETITSHPCKSKYPRPTQPSPVTSQPHLTIPIHHNAIVKYGSPP